METKLVKLTIGYKHLIVPSEIATAMLNHSDEVKIFDPYEVDSGKTLTQCKFTIEPLPSDFYEIIAGAKAMGSSYSDYKNNSQ